MLGLLVLSVVAPLSAPRMIAIDARKQTPISPYIYGINYPDNWIYDWLKEWNAYHDGFTLAREGGNRFTAYNWETNASNAGNDYFFENDDYLAVSNDPGWTVRQFLRAVQGARAAALVTVPTLGYVSADKTTEMNGSRDVGQTPNYLETRFLRSYPSKPGSPPMYPPDLTDRAVYQDGFVAWVEHVKSATTPVWFSLDNEPDLWSGTHRRIERSKTTYERIISNNIAYARMIKSVAPDSLVFGPVNYGWQGMKSFQDAPDAAGRPFVETYLDAVRKASKSAHRRLVDVYDFHWYPEATGGGVRIIYGQSPDKPETEAARIQSPRSLWDPTYVEKSWITNSLGGKPIMMLPRMAEKVAKHFPGTKLAITEYEFGGRTKMSGALAQADALGVFGRYGLFAACHWGINHTEKPVDAAFEAFTNFDRRGGRFGDRELAVQGEDPASNSVYAALDSHNRRRMTIVVINKTAEPMQLLLSPRGFSARSVRAFAVVSGSYDDPAAAEARLDDGRIALTAPPLSIVTAEALRR